MCPHRLPPWPVSFHPATRRRSPQHPGAQGQGFARAIRFAYPRGGPWCLVRAMPGCGRRALRPSYSLNDYVPAVYGGASGRDADSRQNDHAPLAAPATVCSSLPSCSSLPFWSTVVKFQLARHCKDKLRVILSWRSYVEPYRAAHIGDCRSAEKGRASRRKSLVRLETQLQEYT